MSDAAPLYTGVVFDWYKQRLIAMFERPPCKLHVVSNHLLGCCPTCGEGRYAKSKHPIQTLPIGRSYTYRALNLGYEKQLLWVLKQYPLAMTNLEFPLPIVTVDKRSRIPGFYDPETNTVIDFMNYTRSNKQIMVAMDETVRKAGMDLKVFDGTNAVYTNAARAHEELVSVRLRRFLRSSIGVATDAF